MTGHHPHRTGLTSGLLFGSLPLPLAGLAVVPAVFTTLGFNHLLLTGW
ncbi:hypothetical protein ACWDBW_08075 [Streptomyces sp. NPDC001107]